MIRIWWWFGLAPTIGCTDWPRFAHPPDGKLVAYGGQIALRDHLTEAADFPCEDSPVAVACDPGPLEPHDGLLAEPYYALAIEGTASPAGYYSASESVDPFVGLYTGDVDFVRLPNPGGTVCLLIETFPYEPSLWDVVAYAYDPAIDGITGDFLTRPVAGDPTIPSSIAVGGCEKAADDASGATGCNFFRSDAPEIALYIAEAKASTTTGQNVTYTLYVYPTTYDSGCDDLSPERFVPEVP